MSDCSSRGFSLAELLLAMVLLTSLILAIGPVVARTGSTLTRGRVLLEGSRMASHRRALLAPDPSTTCGPGTAGVDSGRLAVVRWRSSVGIGGLAFEAAISDHRLHFPAETLIAVIPCLP